jgi:class 3 adenylate cyclase
MNFDGLQTDYWNRQIARVETLRQKISSRAAISPGRVIPDDLDLVIGTGRRINATILFLDICRFSERSSSTADEQEMMIRVLNLFFTEMIRITEDYGGVVEKNTGDGLMAYFEDKPLGSGGENSTKCATACALTMQAANTNLISPILRASGVLPIEYRTTIEHGTVTIARIGAPQRFNANVAVGNAANFASKMLGQVKADQIGMGRAAWLRLPDYWRNNWSSLAPINTGWTYGTPPQPYPLYLYTGRWVKLI